MEEVDQASNLISEEAHEDANIIWGTVFDDDLGDELRITVIATGIGEDFRRPARPPMEVVRSVLGKGEKGPEEPALYTPLKPQRPAEEFKGLSELDEEELDIPTFLRRRAD